MANTPLRPARKRDAERTAALLLKTAERLFVRKGFQGVSVDEIATEAGVNKRMIYCYYGSKAKLYEEVLRRNFEKALSLRAGMGDLDEDPVRAIHELARRYFFFLARNTTFVKLLTREMLDGDPRSLNVIQEQALSGAQVLHEVIAGAMSAGLLRSDLDVRLLSLSFNSLFLNFFIMRPLLVKMWGRELTSGRALEEVLQGMLALIQHGCLASPCELS